ncbi:MAG: PAS domain S-box protein [Desmonostoc vinosum HA7617-LM4]|jgi:PAS domain S-box-containing protein|nr:PAS domain S-box protein [Desmonostoc vinosum HA7617-LM4]
MIALPGVTIHSKIYESSLTLVYRGIRERENCAVIAKVLKQDYPSSCELTRYRQEYEITCSLNIEGVVKAYSQQNYQRTLFILLEDFGGESLEYWMRQQSDFCPMPLSTFLGLAIAITKTLGRIHAAHVIHKDINPGNIVFNPNTGVVKIIDFGIATRLGRTNLTFKSLHLLEGTPAYLSPEQTGRMNRMLDYRTDFYSLGATFYELLTGQLPFPTQDILELVHCHIAKPPIPPHELNATIPQPVSDLILKLMAKNAEDRYQSAWGIKADLQRCVDQLKATGQIDPIQLGLQDVSAQFQIPQKLYGREAQIEALLAAFDRVAGKTFSECQLEEGIENAQLNVELMLVAGYAGVGKTALVQELYKPITAKHSYFISGKFDQFGRNVPYSAIAHALQKLVQQLLGEPDEQLQQWQEHLLTALGNNGQIIIDVIPEVELIIGKQPPVPEVGATEAQNRFNLTFQRFMRAFCAKEHPLAIFLDDLQWIDSATLKLIELILLDEQTQYLFLIGAYRDNEVTPTHPLVLTLEKLRKGGAVLQEIILTPLTLEPLSQLIAETLHHNPDTVRPLAQAVSRKTEGNPFFVGEFLKMLHGENLLTFDTQQLSWQWNLTEIDAQDITDNVVELLLRQLQKLPEATQQILCLAACVGAEFDLETLAIAWEKSPKAIFQDLLAAVQAGLIQPLSNLDEDLLVQEYKFSHDRVQQAAYTLIDESHKQVIHLQIGRNLLEKTSPEQRAERLFAIVDHLNQGIELVTAQPERTEIARLNLMAGQKAKSATAYEAALQYFNTGLKLLDTDSWLSEYDLTLALYSQAAEAAYLRGRFDKMNQFAEVVLIHAKTVLDKVQVYNSRIQSYLSQGNLKEALKTGLEVLNLLGVILPENPSQLDVQRGLEETASLLAGREIADLINSPKMTASEPRSAMYILTNIRAVAFLVSPLLMILILCKMVNLSINYGNTTWSPLGYASYGLVLCGIVQDIERGYQFSKLALGLAERLNSKKGSVKALLVVSANVMHWKVHFRKTIPILVESYQNGVETGDFEYASYAAYGACYYLFFVGESLTQLEQKTATYSKAIGQIRRENPSNWLTMLWQTVLNLLGKSLNLSRLIGRVYDEEQALSHAVAVKDGLGICCFYLNKVILCYLFGEHYQAVQNAVLARQYFEEITPLMVIPLFNFYDSLVLLSLFVEASSSQKAAWLSCVSTNQEKMQKWADHAPMNYLHKYYLVEAEKARVLGQFLEAEEFYEQAIAGASEHEFIQEEALAYELAAKHYLARGRSKIAQTYMKEAHYCYDRWGAAAKVTDLETRYPQFFSQSPRVVPRSISTTSETIANTSHTALDLAAVMKASQAISREIELEQLLRSLMQILIQNAGAQTGYLILENSGEWLIEAACEFNDENVCDTQVLQSIPTVDQLPESIVQYVIRTQESVTLNDAICEGAFINELYIQQHQTKSILCLPLLNQAKLVGVLYLENQLAAGAFTPERTQVLHLLSTQAAIAIENAKLYSQLRASKNELTQFFEAIPVGIVVADTTGRPCYSNQQATQLVGKTFDPALSVKQLAKIHQVQLAGTDQPYPTEQIPIVRALSGERTKVDDIEIQRDDTTIPIEAWGTPVFDEQGNVAYAIATFQDITERKQAEKLLADYNRTLEQQVVERTAALQASEAALREREQELRLITDALPALISYVDINQRYQFVNRNFEVWFCRSRNEILGKSIRELLGEAAYQVVQVYVDRVLAGETVTYEAEMPYPFGNKYVSATFIPDFDRHNRVRGLYGLVTDISDRKRIEDALRQSEANYRNLIKTANSIIIRSDMQGRIQYLNDYGLRFFGYEEHQILGRTLLETIVPETETSGRNLKQFVHDVIHNFKSYSPESYFQSENENLCRDGRRVWVAWSNQAILNEQGESVEILSVGHDITQRKQAEEALQRSEAKFRNIFENSQVGIFRTRLSDGLILDANQRFADLFGFDSPEEVIGLKHGTDCYANPSDRQRAIELLEQNGELQNFEVKLQRRDGTLFWGLYSTRLNAADECIDGVIADISDRVSAEAALQASETELRALIAAIPDPLFVLTAEGKILNMTIMEPHLRCELTEEMIGKTMHQFGKEQADEFVGYIQQVLRTQQILTVEYSMVLNGRETWISARIAPFRHEQVIWLARDITVHKQAEAASILEERNRMAREIHDTLAQAFTGILIQVGAATQVLTDEPEATQAHLDTIEELARTGLSEARRSVRALRPQLLESGDLSSALQRLVNQMRATTDTALIYKVQGIAYPLPAEVENNLLRIGQEALTNAIKYAQAGEIRVELVYDNGQCILRVKDDGQGFGVGSVPLSSGFGLLGMSERAEHMGAQLLIGSQPKQGTEIVVIVDRK